MPPLRKVKPIHYLTCSIYSDEKRGQWRAVEWSARRKDVKFLWSGEKDSWDRCLKWCEENSK